MYQGRSPVHKLTWYQYFLLDVILLCVGVMYILFKIFQILCARCCSKRSKIKGEWYQHFLFTFIYIMKYNFLRYLGVNRKKIINPIKYLCRIQIAYPYKNNEEVSWSKSVWLPYPFVIVKKLPMRQTGELQTLSAAYIATDVTLVEVQNVMHFFAKRIFHQ